MTLQVALSSDTRPDTGGLLVSISGYPPIMETDIDTQVPAYHKEVSTSTLGPLLPREIDDKLPIDTPFEAWRTIPMMSGPGSTTDPEGLRFMSSDVRLSDSIGQLTPEIVEHSSLDAVLTDRVRWVVDRVLEILHREAARSFVPVSRIELSGFIDPEEDCEQAVIVQWVRLPASMALDYWDRAANAVANWASFLPDEVRRIPFERLAIEVRWEADD